MTLAGSGDERLSRRAFVGTAAGAGAAALGGLGFPAIVTAQAGTLRIGHLAPRTWNALASTRFLGQQGDAGFNGSVMAVEEANAGGGVLGRRIELIAEDSVNRSWP